MRINSDNGFSLIELILVIAILSLLSCVLLPSIDIDYFYMKNDVQIVYSTFRKVRQKAITDSANYKIKLISGNRIGIQKSGSDKFERIINIHKKLSLTCSKANNQISFTPLGTASAGSFVISHGRNSKKVVVAASGRIRLE